MKPNMEICPICGKEFQNGPHSYGKYLRGYQITVCRDCYLSNQDGWARHYEGILEEIMDEKGIDYPERNDDGLYPVDF